MTEELWLLLIAVTLIADIVAIAVLSAYLHKNKCGACNSLATLSMATGTRSQDFSYPNTWWLTPYVKLCFKCRKAESGHWKTNI
jgi:hypothetical protein